MRRLAILIVTALAFLAPAPVVLAKDCPPGLAKKTPKCVPPGQAKKGVTAEEWADRRGDADSDEDDDDDEDRRIVDDEDLENVYVTIDGRRYLVGQRLPDGRVIIDDPDLLGLLPPLEDGHVYMQIDDKVVEAVRATNLFVRALGAADALLN